MDSLKELLEQADSLMNTLDKDYEAMKTTRSTVKSNLENELNELCDTLHNILMPYEKRLHDFKTRSDKIFDSMSSEHSFFSDDEYTYLFQLGIYWAKDYSWRPCIQCIVFTRSLNDTSGYCAKRYIMVSPVGIQHKPDIDYIIATFLNHCPEEQQLTTVFKEAMTEHVKKALTYIQQRNEKLAKQIKEVTS